jgi:DNA-directed RNA polymerase specialized sigma24 family protein
VVLQSRDVDGVPMQDIAARLGIPLQTAYTRLRNGRRNFTRLMRRRWMVADARAALSALQSAG